MRFFNSNDLLQSAIEGALGRNIATGLNSQNRIAQNFAITALLHQGTNPATSADLSLSIPDVFTAVAAKKYVPGNRFSIT